MSSQRQQQASRANGSKSRGPTSPAGKLASSRNAITHGMLSSAIVLQGESKDRFHAHLALFYKEFQPQTPFEESLIENMAVARWRQVRIWGMETAGIGCEMTRQAEMSLSTPAEDAATRASRAFRRLSDDSHSLDLIHRYDSRYDRQYYRAHRRFEEVRDRRTPLPPPQSAPNRPRPDEGTFPAGESAISKGTPEVVENKPAAPGTSSRQKRRTCGYQPRSSSRQRTRPVSPRPRQEIMGVRR
jgi:hypothetical protein